VVFTIVNVSVLVLRRDTVEGDHFRAPTVLPVLGAVVSVALMVHSVSDDTAVVLRAVLLLAAGAALFGVTRLSLR
jgi:basic amino acid/polyamine antiporter, APA family